MSSPRNATSPRASQRIMASALDAVVGMDAAGRIVAWNARAEEMFGWKADEVMGKPMHRILLPERYR